MVIGKADGKIRAQAVGVVKAREVLIRHPRPAGLEVGQMGIPVGQGVFSIGSRRLENLVPKGVIGFVGVKIRIEELGPDGARYGGDEPRRLRGHHAVDIFF